MAKLPFGGLWDEASDPPVDQRDDPVPLLAEVAQCAFDGAPLRPQLARWFHSAWSSGRIKIKAVRGVRPKDPSGKMIEAILMLRKIPVGTPGIEQEIAKVRKLLGLKASSTAIHAFRRELAAVDEKQRSDFLDDVRNRALKQFRQLADQRVQREAALEQVMVACDPEHRLPVENFREWQSYVWAAD
jgi:hypothetical protein